MSEVTVSGLITERKVLVASMPLETSTNESWLTLISTPLSPAKGEGQHLRSIILNFPLAPTSYFGRQIYPATFTMTVS